MHVIMCHFKWHFIFCHLQRVEINETWVNFSMTRFLTDSLRSKAYCSYLKVHFFWRPEADLVWMIGSHYRLHQVAGQTEINLCRKCLCYYFRHFFLLPRVITIFIKQAWLWLHLAVKQAFDFSSWLIPHSLLFFWLNAFENVGVKCFNTNASTAKKMFFKENALLSLIKTPWLTWLKRHECDCIIYKDNFCLHFAAIQKVLLVFVEQYKSGYQHLSASWSFSVRCNGISLSFHVIKSVSRSIAHL